MPPKEINAVYLFKTVNGKIADYDAPIAKVMKKGLTDGAGIFTFADGALAAGDALRIAVQYWKDDELYYFEACDLTVAGEQEAGLHEHRRPAYRGFYHRDRKGDPDTMPTRAIT